MQSLLFQRIKSNTAAGKNPLLGIDPALLGEVASLLEDEFATLRQIWGICDSAIRHYEDEQIESFQDDPDMTNVILTHTAGYWEKLSPVGAQLRQHITEIESLRSNPSFNALAYYANEATTIRHILIEQANWLSFHPAGIIGKSKLPFEPLSIKSCFSVKD
jgi:hypothetical protein